MVSPDADGWKDVMDQEMANLKSHDYYELVPRMNDMRTLKRGWVFHRKFKSGVFEKKKGRIVARANHQRPGIDYVESFLPVMRLESFHTIPRPGSHSRPRHHLSLPPWHAQEGSLYGAARGLCRSWKEGLGRAPLEGPSRVGTSRKNVERRFKCSHGE